MPYFYCCKSSVCRCSEIEKRTRLLRYMHPVQAITLLDAEQAKKMLDAMAQSYPELTKFHEEVRRTLLNRRET